MGGKGSQASDQMSGNAGMQNLQNAPRYLSDPRMQDILSNYGSGKTSLADALSAARGPANPITQAQEQQAFDAMEQARRNISMAQGPGSDQAKDQLTNKFHDAEDSYHNLMAAKAKGDADAAGGMDRMNNLFTNPLTGSKAATDQVMGNELFKPYADYGKGLIDQHGKVSGFLDDDRNALLGRDESYGLQDSDLKAFGQASDNIGRQYASSDQSLAQMLADRGLSQAPSGAAVQAFSTQLGNKNEQLAQMQQQIAQSRINTARGLAQDRMSADLQRSGQLQSGIQGMGDLSRSAVNDQFNRNLAGVQQYGQQNRDSLAAGQAQQQQQNEMFGQQQATKGPSFGDILAGAGTGLLGAATGGFGTAVGSAAGQGLGKALNPNAIFSSTKKEP